MFLLQNNSSQQPNLTTERLDIDPVMCYHVLQTAAFCLMTIIIMRLKLFFIPQLCILSALLLNTKVSFLSYCPIYRENQNNMLFVAIQLKCLILFCYIVVCALYSFSSFTSVPNRSISGRNEYRRCIKYKKATQYNE